MTDFTPGPYDIAVDAQRARRGSNLRFLVAILGAATAVAWVATTSFDQQIYFHTVSELDGHRAEIGTTEFRVKGNVVAGSHRLREGTLDEHLFTLVEGGQTLEVFYRGALPDTFSDDAEVVALGRLRPEGDFVAEEVVAKCPSRYEEQPPTASASR